MPEFGEKGKENFTRQLDFFARLSGFAIKKVRKKLMETKNSQGIYQTRATLWAKLGRKCSIEGGER